MYLVSLDRFRCPACRWQSMRCRAKAAWCVIGEWWMSFACFIHSFLNRGKCPISDKTVTGPMFLSWKFWAGPSSKAQSPSQWVIPTFHSSLFWGREEWWLIRQRLQHTIFLMPKSDSQFITWQNDWKRLWANYTQLLNPFSKQSQSLHQTPSLDQRMTRKSEWRSLRHVRPSLHRCLAGRCRSLGSPGSQGFRSQQSQVPCFLKIGRPLVSPPVCYSLQPKEINRNPTWPSPFLS